MSINIRNFTVNFDLLAIKTDAADVNLNADIVPLTADVVFTPVLLGDNAILAKDYEPRPAGFKPCPIVGCIDVDGRLKANKSGPVGVRLIANDPILRLPGPLVYNVEFANVRTLAGQPMTLESGYFAAPTDDVTVNLVDVLQPALVPLVNLSGGTISGTSVIFQNSDGSYLNAIPIPPGVLVLVDNGDSTWSVGGA